MARLPKSMEVTGLEDSFSTRVDDGIVELTLGDFGHKPGVVQGRTFQILAWLGVYDQAKAEPEAADVILSAEDIARLDPGIGARAHQQMDQQQQ